MCAMSRAQLSVPTDIRWPLGFALFGNALLSLLLASRAVELRAEWAAWSAASAAQQRMVPRATLSTNPLARPPPAAVPP
jgi:hypothetical protein